MKTGIITTDSYSDHDTGLDHPERSDRVSVIIDNLKKSNNKNLIWKKPGNYEKKFIKYAHCDKYINKVEKSFPKNGSIFLDGDTIISPGSKKAITDAVGSIITAIDCVQKKEIKNAFCIVRPPGHHAEKDKAMGFCIYNNVAVGAYYLLNNYNFKKVAIIDFDVHHGNGTQEIFYNDETVAYGSSHEFPLFPGSGLEEETGAQGRILGLTAVRSTIANDLTAVFLCYDVQIYSQTESMPCDEILESKWIGLSELKNLNWVSDTMHNLAIGGLSGSRLSIHSSRPLSKSDKSYHVYSMNRQSKYVA